MLKDRYILERESIKQLMLESDADLLHPVFGEGNEQRPLIMFIGEAPGKEEAACGRPFVGKAGKQLDEMLAVAGIDRSKVFVTNAVKFRPYKTKNGRVSNRTPNGYEIICGLDILRQEIDVVIPHVIAPLGNVPLNAVMQLAAGTTEPYKIGAAHGKPYAMSISGRHVRVFPLYHPAAGIYNRELRPIMQQDLINLGEYARNSYKRDKEILGL